MAIVRFWTNDEAAALEQCAAEGGEWQGLTDAYEVPVYIWRTHVGLCIKEYEYNGRDDSDFYMTVYNPTTDEFEEHCFASTRGWTYPAYGSKPDATPEVMAKWEAHLRAREERARQAAARQEAMRPARGKRMRVVKGRKVAVGTEGDCIWVGDGRFGLRVGIKDNGGTVHWTAASNVEVVLISA